MKTMKDNKGFSLVELVIAFGILSIVMVIVGAVIGMSSGTYRNISNDLSLQYESQLAMSQIQEYVIDCNGYIASSDDVLYIFNEHVDGEDTQYKGFKLALDGNTLMLYTNSSEDEPELSDFGDGQPMSDNVRSFEAALSTSGGTVTAVNITLYYKLGRDEYTGVQTIALRNTVTVMP